MWTNTYATEPYGVRGIYIWQPIGVDAPADARPHCCYRSTVIFYDRAAWLRGKFVKLAECDQEWDLVGQRWTDDTTYGWQALAPFVDVSGVIYELADAKVGWRGRFRKTMAGYRRCDRSARMYTIDTAAESAAYALAPLDPAVREALLIVIEAIDRAAPRRATGEGE